MRRRLRRGHLKLGHLRHCGRVAVLLSLAGMLAACATPQQRIRSGLIQAGISQPVANCMADRMADRLSLLQMRRLARLGDLRDSPVGDTTLNQYLHRARALQDPEIWGVVSSSAAVCVVRSL